MRGLPPRRRQRNHHILLCIFHLTLLTPRYKNRPVQQKVPSLGGEAVENRCHNLAALLPNCVAPTPCATQTDFANLLIFRHMQQGYLLVLDLQRF